MEVQFNNLYTHFILTTRDRFPAIEEKHRIRVEKYITGIVNRHHCKLYAIYANPEHVHLLISRDPAISERELINLIAEASEIFINDNKMCRGRFYWQASCSAFSVSKRDIDKVCKYILNQPEHHKKRTFAEEYEQFLIFYQHTLSPQNKINKGEEGETMGGY